MDEKWVPDIFDRVMVGRFEAVVVSVSLSFEIVTVLIHRPGHTEPRTVARTFEWARSHWSPLPRTTQKS